jgi:cell wall-associated NlpC family hydrolase
MLLEKDIRKIAVDYAMQFVGKFYKWGGDDPSGFDCSGLIIEVLKAVGVLERKGDWRARDLHNKYDSVLPALVVAGDLVFWRAARGGPIIHVEMLINEKLAIGASGGGSATISTADAIRQNAFIKIRPVDSRPGLAGYRNPYSNPYYSIISA